MTRTASKLAMVGRLLVKGEFWELLRRTRLATTGIKPIPFPDDDHFDFGTSSLFGSVGDGDTNDNTMPQGNVKPIRSLMFSHNLNLEGAPISQFELTRALVEAKVIDPIIVSFSDGPLRARYEASSMSVKILPQYLDRISSLARLKVVLDELSDLMLALRVQVVYANTLLNFGPVIAAHKAGIPSVWNIRESEPWQTIFGFLERGVAQRALASISLPHRVIFVAEATRDVWRPFDKHERFLVVPNKLDLRDRHAITACDRLAIRKALGYEESEVVFLSVGTLCERKGQRDLIKALGCLAHDGANRTRVCIVGSAEPRYYRQLCADLAGLPVAVRNAVTIHEATEDVSAYYAAADVFVLSSRLESCPRVVLEAMSYRLPLLVTPVFWHTGAGNGGCAGFVLSARGRNGIGKSYALLGHR
jgi:glycosyltransferase involved in cell wall biosynthesis